MEVKCSHCGKLNCICSTPDKVKVDAVFIQLNKNK